MFEFDTLHTKTITDRAASQGVSPLRHEIALDAYLQRKLERENLVRAAKNQAARASIEKAAKTPWSAAIKLASLFKTAKRADSL